MEVSSEEGTLLRSPRWGEFCRQRKASSGCREAREWDRRVLRPTREAGKIENNIDPRHGHAMRAGNCWAGTGWLWNETASCLRRSRQSRTALGCDSSGDGFSSGILRTLLGSPHLVSIKKRTGLDWMWWERHGWWVTSGASGFSE